MGIKWEQEETEKTDWNVAYKHNGLQKITTYQLYLINVNETPIITA